MWLERGRLLGSPSGREPGEAKELALAPCQRRRLPPRRHPAGTTQWRGGSCLEAQGDHGEAQLPRVNGAAAVGVEEQEYLPNLRLLSLSELAARSCVPVRVFGISWQRRRRRAEVGAGVEAAGDMPGDEGPEEDQLRANGQQASATSAPC